MGNPTKKQLDKNVADLKRALFVQAGLDSMSKTQTNTPSLPSPNQHTQPHGHGISQPFPQSGHGCPAAAGCCGGVWSAIGTGPCVWRHIHPSQTLKGRSWWCVVGSRRSPRR